MRFLCVCVAVLSGLLAVRCSVFMPEPAETAVNIMRGVLANDREWRDIIGRVMDVNALDSDGMLDELGLRGSSTTGITPQKVIERLIVRNGSTGRQLMFGVRVLGIALENQFVKTVAAHSLVAVKYTELRTSTPWSLRVCISSIQQSLVVFANKVAFFGHNVDFFWDLNNIINVFLRENHSLLEDREPTKETERSQIASFFSTLLNEAQNRLGMLELDMKKEEVLEILNLKQDIDLYDSEIHYYLVNNIDYYKLVDVSTFRLEFGEKVFEIIKYNDNSLVKKGEAETETEETA